MKEFVDAIEQKENGVSLHLSGEVEKEKIDTLISKCGPNGTGCDSDCCDPEFTALVEDIEAYGKDGDITMHILGAVTSEMVSDKMSQCDCYNEV